MSRFSPIKVYFSVSLPKNIFLFSIILITLLSSSVWCAEWKEMTLPNKIPLYYRTLPSKVSSLYIVIEGAEDDVNSDLSGISSATLSLMERASTSRSHATVASYTHDTSTSIRSSSNSLGAVFCMTTLEKYFKESLDLLLDLFLHPAFDEENYQILMMEQKAKLTKRQADAQRALFNAIENDFAPSNSLISSKTLPNIKLGTIKTFYKTLLNPKKISVIIAGATPLKVLESSLTPLGNLPSTQEKLSNNKDNKNQDVSQNPAPYSSPRLLKIPSAGRAAVIARVSPAPKPYDDDYGATIIASDIYNDVLFNIVREKKGVCYSVQSFVSARGYLMEALLSVRDYKGFSTALNEARDTMARGELPSSQSKETEGKETLIDEVLPHYIRAYITDTYSAKDSAEGVAREAAINLLQGATYQNKNKTNENKISLLSKDDRLIERIRTLTGQEVLDAFNKYWPPDSESQKKVWYAAADEKTCRALKF